MHLRPYVFIIMIYEDDQGDLFNMFICHLFPIGIFPHSVHSFSPKMTNSILMVSFDTRDSPLMKDDVKRDASHTNQRSNGTSTGVKFDMNTALSTSSSPSSPTPTSPRKKGAESPPHIFNEVWSFYLPYPLLFISLSLIHTHTHTLTLSLSAFRKWMDDK